MKQRILVAVVGVPALLAVLCAVFVRDYPEQAGAFPDNDRSFDKAQAEQELKAGLEYMKTSPWTPGKMLSYKLSLIHI